MNSPIEISDDDTDFYNMTWDDDESEISTRKKDDSSALISDDEDPEILPIKKDTFNKSHDTVSLSSDEDELPSVNLKQIRRNYIKQLFPNVTASTSKNDAQLLRPIQEKPKDKGVTKMIGGVEVCLPVTPYGSQIALMAKIIEAMRKGKNCLLESPTGSGKTLALLCGALACQLHEKNTLAKNLAEELLKQHQQLDGVSGMSEYIATPKKEVPPEQLFANVNFGSKTIYDQPRNLDTQASRGNKRDQTTRSNSSEDSNESQVRIHKKPRNASPASKHWEQNTASNKECCTPEKPIEKKTPQTPEQVRTPTIYYGARTHKQLEQVVKEFSRTWYCGQSNMTLLSSRDYSCLREFDKKLWGTKNDMCRGCVKGYKDTSGVNQKNTKTNCKFYDNRMALNRKSLPPAFDLEDLVAKGNELGACPYYAARMLETDADIVFCPYNYLIDPSIRSSLQIELEGNILIIDEGHNIEDICRDAATYTFTKDQVANAIKELQVATSYRFQNNDVSYLEILLTALLSFEQWFTNQIPLIKNKPVMRGEALYKWEVLDFIQTLNNHNIGQAHYPELCRCAEALVRAVRESPRALLGVSQGSVSLLANLASALGYLFQDSGKHMNDFKPIFIRQVTGQLDDSQRTWKTSQFNRSIDSETYTLKLLCLNPAVVFESLKCAKCIILASGTLTPMISFHSELGTDFALQVSPNHVIPKDRVWIGSLGGGARPLLCTSAELQRPDTQDALGAAVCAVCAATPHGVLCFLPSYAALHLLRNRWRETSTWGKLQELKYIYQESRNVHDHNEIIKKFQEHVCHGKGALLLAVYRGKVSEGMDFKDRQARAVITIGIPFPNMYDVSVSEKKLYNNKYKMERNLLDGDKWLQVQAFRALNQAVGRCVRHRADWGAVLMIDARFSDEGYTQYLSTWVRNFLGRNHHTIESLLDSSNGLNNFMQSMTLNDENID